MVKSHLSNMDVVVIYKHSRFSYAESHPSRGNGKFAHGDEKIEQDLFKAHEENLKSIDAICDVLKGLGIHFHIIGRNELDNHAIENKLVVTIGGDGTLLDASHYCDTSPILGVNSDPDSSVGALCVAHRGNFKDVMLEIYDGRLKPIPLSRLAITKGKDILKPLALNDVLFCHKNPAAMSRFNLSQKNVLEAHRSSGIWVSTAAGSTGGIYSSGAKPLLLDEKYAIFRIREPYWSDKSSPQLLEGSIKNGDALVIQSSMNDAELFIDGPHRSVDVGLGESITIKLSDKPLWLFDGPRLSLNRERIIRERMKLNNE